MKKAFLFFMPLLLAACSLNASSLEPSPTIPAAAQDTAIPSATQLTRTGTPEPATQPPDTPIPSPTHSPSSTPPQPAGERRGPAFPSFYTFHWFDEKDGWAETLEGRILRSTDGGRSWVDVTPAGVTSARGATTFFLDPEKAWFMSTQGYSTGKLFHTADGGQTWEAYDTPFGYIAASSAPLTFLDEAQGWIGGPLECGQSISHNCPFSLYQTMDGGRTWLAPKTITYPQDLLDRASTTYIAITVQNPKTLLAVPGQVIPGWPLTLYLTRDAARTWQAAPVPGPLPGAGHLGAVGGQAGGENPRLKPPVFLTDQEAFSRS